MTPVAVHHTGCTACCCPCVAAGINARRSGACAAGSRCSCLLCGIAYCICPCIVGAVIRGAVQTYVGMVCQARCRSAPPPSSDSSDSSLCLGPAGSQVGQEELRLPHLLLLLRQCARDASVHGTRSCRDGRS